MIALKIPDVKDFMNKLLCTETFDHFLLQEATIQNSISYNIEGTLNQDFYSEDEQMENGVAGLTFIPFGKVRTQCFDLIKGKRTPAFFKFVLLLSPANLKRTLEQTHSSFTENDVSAVFLNLRFQNSQLTITTGISYRTFIADKSLDHEWDQLVMRFLKSHEIVCEEV